jgi:hypothetical protein
MDDTLKTLVFGFLGMIVFHSGLEGRARRDISREVRGAFAGSGTVRTTLEARGMFGAIGNHFYAVDVYGSHLEADRLPFVSIPRAGWKGHIRHLRLHFDHLLLNGLPVRQFEADVPNVTYDLGRALYKDRLVIRGAGEGPAAVTVGADGLRTFIARKFSRMIAGADVSFRAQRVAITGRLLLFGGDSPFTAIGQLEARDGRYLDVVRPTVELNGQPLPEAMIAGVLKQMNPVLDVSTDLGLGGYFTLERVQIGDDQVTIYGRAAIPVRSAPLRP